MKAPFRRFLLGALAGVAAFACETPAPRTTPVPLQQLLPAVDSDGFSPENAWAHLRALVEIGPRVSKSEGAERARSYIEGQLDALGIERPASPWLDALPPETELTPLPAEMAEIPPPIIGRLPGASTDPVLLVAPFDSRAFDSFEFVGANDGASGAAILLELARAFAKAELPYTVWLVFVEGDAHYIEDRRSLRGSLVLAQRLQDTGLAERVRLAVTLNRLCDADLRVARDLLSYRPYRDEFWRAADRLGFRDYFEQERFQSPAGSHLALRAAGIQRVTALADTSFGGEDPPGLYANTEDDDLDHCAPESLGVVGEVTLEALENIFRRLAKIDRFSRSPLANVAGRPEEAPPKPEVVPAPGADS